MLQYEWGSSSSPIMLSGDEVQQQEPPNNQQQQQQDNHRCHVFSDHYISSTTTTAPPPFTDQQHQLIFHHNQQQHTTALMYNNNSPSFQTHQQRQYHQNSNISFYDPRPYFDPSQLLHSMDPLHSSPNCSSSSSSYFLVPKAEEPVDYTARLGLNLGGRTYFSSTEEDDFVNRLYRRTRPHVEANVPRCQAEDCNADLTHAKHYHRRHKVCEFHSKASTVIAAGLTQRFCQQCSRFHLLSEFDNGKRSCRKRLADHNRRRRKSNQQTNNINQPDHSNTTSTTDHKEPAPTISSSTENITRCSPPDSGAQSSSSVTVAMSPPRMFLDCFKQRPY